MKKVLAIVLTLCMALSLCACGSSAPAASAPTASAPAATEKTETAAPAGEPINYVYYANSADGWYDDTLDMFADKLSELSNGRFVATSFPAGTMGNEAESIDATLMNEMQVTIAAEAIIFNAIGCDDLESIPGIVSSEKEAEEVILDENGWYAQITMPVIEEGGLVRVGATHSGFRVIGGKGELDSMDKLVGLKMRTGNSPIPVNLYAGVGILPTIIDSSETIPALQQGTVNAVENSLQNLVSRGFREMCDSVLLVNKIYTSRDIIVNADWFNSLSAEDQALVKEAGKYACDWANGQYAENMADMLTGWNVYELDDEMNVAFDKSIAALMDSIRDSYKPELFNAIYSHVVG